MNSSSSQFLRSIGSPLRRLPFGRTCTRSGNSEAGKTSTGGAMLHCALKVWEVEGESSEMIYALKNFEIA